ncbi:hypothetical protein K440DRAFT_638015 [Wilcoxina mikolae CBS 423.85]|nr:hypothetical protein K440DRAFT_638015 [Wilcoxina mikolae CBS 423.85]
MAELQPRRYITRARAQAGSDSAVTSTAGTSASRATRNISTGKRKALTESTQALENSRNQPDDEPQTKFIKSVVKKPATRGKNAGNSSGLSAAPRRSGRTGNNDTGLSNCIDAKTICSRTLAHAKKVTFASPPPSSSEDKENATPSGLPATPKMGKPQVFEETDELMSTSMGALSVKPKRFPQSKLQQPTTGTFASPMPALSPQKARRPKRLYDLDDAELEDELLCPTSPKLLEKPKRPMAPLGKNIEDGADLLIGSKSTLKPSALLSPARRFPQSPSKLKESVSLNPQASPSKTSALSTPPRRPQGSGSRLGMSISKSTTKASSLKFSISMDDSDDPFSDACGPSLVDDGISHTKPILERKLFVREDSSLAKNAPHVNLDFKEPLGSIKDEKRLASPEASELDSNSTTNMDADISTTPPTPPSKFQHPVISPTDTLKRHTPAKREADVPVKKEEEVVKADVDGDIPMDDILGSNRLSPTPAAPQAKKYCSPSEGGSSFGLFDFGEEDDDEDMDYDSENVPPPQATAVTNLASKLDSIEFDRQKDGSRGFGQEIDLSTKQPNMKFDYGDIPVDPMLLSEDISDVVIGYSECPAPVTTVPVKFHSEDDDVFGDDGERQYTMSADLFGRNLPHQDEESRRRRRSSGVFERTGGVLAGAVVFVDAYTNDGGNCAETFEKMLKGMGSKVLKQWNWNPDSASPGKVGITHVVFKDGSPRTLQKVKATKGLVSCVTLAWVMECAQQDEWLDESAYVIDLNDVPRGGHKRRKSMEPQKMDELISQLTSAPKDRSRTTPKTIAPKTPQRMYPSQLVPRTEPPKFDLSTVSPFLTERIRIARRQSMQFAPKISSPLMKSWSVAE